MRPARAGNVNVALYPSPSQRGCGASTFEDSVGAGKTLSAGVGSDVPPDGAVKMRTRSVTHWPVLSCAILDARENSGDFGARSTVTGSPSNPRDASLAAVTTPAGLGGACARCGATVATGSTTCSRCGATITGANPAEQAERIRLRLQESIGDAYRLVELLGRGGMGIVFRAHELALDREVALKVLALDPILSSEAYARFEREAKLAARLDHPNVVPIFAVGQRNTVAFYTMRLVRGGTLEDMLAGHRALDFNHAIEILRDVASAVDYAHGQGVVHRDIKPANVLIADSGHAMVSDFGIARGLGLGDAGLAAGTVIGSPGYMPPEQWRGEEIDARGDQYALAVMAFELLTGHRPFETVKVQDLMKLHLSGEPPNASSLKGTLPPFVDLAIRRAMSKTPSHRFTSATAFVDALAGKRPVSGLTRTLLQAVSDADVGQESGGLIKALLTVSLLAAAVVGIAIALHHPLAGHRGRTTAVAAAAPTPDTPTAVDSTLNVDTTFDLNATAGAGSAANPVRRPVAVDPTLFPQRNAPTGDAPGYIRIVARGGAAKVRVDGRTYGFSPQVVRVEPGAHVVSLEGSGDAFLPAQITVTAAPYDTLAAVFTARTPRGAVPDSDAAPTRTNDAASPAAPAPAPAAVPSPVQARPTSSATPSPRSSSDDATSLPSSVPPAPPPADAAPAPPPAASP